MTGEKMRKPSAAVTARSSRPIFCRHRPEYQRYAMTTISARA
jgi:hypothetical protein